MSSDVQREDAVLQASDGPVTAAKMPGYPSGDEHRDAVIELLCDEWPFHKGYLDWDARCAVVVHLLGVLDRNRLTVIDLGEPLPAEVLRAHFHPEPSNNDTSAVTQTAPDSAVSGRQLQERDQ